MLNKLSGCFSGGAAAARAVYAPLSGTVVALAQVPDPVFSEKMLGDGLAILPASGDVVSPFDGEVASLFPTGHAIGLRSSDGAECLIHIGIDTVELNGAGFTALVRPGDKISKGQLLIRSDLNAIRAAGKAVITPVIVTNSSVWRPVRFADGQVRAGADILFTVTRD